MKTHSCTYNQETQRITCDICGVLDKALGEQDARVVVEKHVRAMSQNPNHIDIKQYLTVV